MAPELQSNDEDWLVAEDYLAGDTQALARLRTKYHSSLIALLIHRGATPTEAEDLAASLWEDCLQSTPEKKSLLQKFSGRSQFRSWFFTVATNRLIDLKRRQNLELEKAKLDPLNQAEAAVSPKKAPEAVLVQTLVDSLKAGFENCSQEALLMMYLVFLQGLTQREVARMWGYHEAKVSRRLDQAMEQIRLKTLERLKNRDAWLELGWQDLIDLCETCRTEFLWPFQKPET